MLKENHNPFIRGSFYKCLKSYRKIRRSKIRKFKQDILDKLDNLQENDPKSYWKLLDELKNKTNNNKEKPENNISPKEWKEYFENLNTIKYQNQELEEMKQKLNSVENDTVFNELDYTISSDEISKAIKSLKNSKACGFSTISNEMIKYSQTVNIPLFKKMFNLVFSNSIYPNSWGQGFITPIHKKGSYHDPANYRGITIADNIGKLFNQILNNRLTKFLTSKNIIKHEQIGFMKGRRTTDHMFILNTLIQKYVKNNSKPLYACFVDFKRAFDSVDHLHLFYKLKTLGIGTMFYKIIKNMYCNTKTCVKINNQRTYFFNSNVGVRQGDNLSPNLFNIFLNDLPNNFDNTCDPVLLQNQSLNMLMYADDVVLLSTSERGLQNCVNKLAKFSRQWKMTLNTQKTKVLVFNKSGRLKNIKIKYEDEYLESVKQYTYLGINFMASGSFQNGKKELYNKGFKALFKLRKVFSSESPKPKTLLHIFNHTIKPILLYGSEIWGYFPIKKHKDIDSYISKEIDSLIIEKIHTKFCKFALCVKNKTSNLASRGELGSLPILCHVYLNMIKYWCHIQKDTEMSNLFLKEAVTLSQTMSKNNQESWISCIQEIFKYLNLEYLFVNQNKYKENFIINKVKKSLIAKFNQHWLTNINCDHGQKHLIWKQVENI